MRWIKLWVPDGPEPMTLEQQGFFDRLLQLAGKCADEITPGKIGISEDCGYTIKQFCKLMNVDEPVFRRLFTWLNQEKMVEVSSDETVTICNWEHYQGEYLRKRDWRDKVTGQMSPRNVPPKKKNEEEELRTKNKEQRNNNKDKNLVPSAPTLIATFVEKYHEKTGEKYFVNGGKDGSLMSSLEKRLGREEVLSRLDRFFSSRDEFILKAGFSIGVFYSQVNKLTGQSGKFAGLKSWAAKQESYAKG